MFECPILQQFAVCGINFLRQGFNIVAMDVFLVKFFLSQFDIDFIGECRDIDVFGLQAKVFDCIVDESIFVADDLAVVGVDDRVRFGKEPIYSADLVQVIFPLFGVLDYHAEVDIPVLGLYLTG